MYHMFDKKNGTWYGDADDFKNLVNSCYMKNRNSECNYKGIFAGHMLGKFLEVSDGQKLR